MIALELKGLSTGIDGRVLMQSLSQSFRGGEHWCVIGPNGVGKSTLLHTLAGLHTADAGEVFLGGVSLSTYAGNQRARRLGISFQHVDIAIPSTVMEYVLVGRHPHIGFFGHESAADIEFCLNVLRRMDLIGLQDRLVSQLSGGELRRLGVATLLSQNPDVMLLDEPVNHLDLRHIHELMGDLEALRADGKLILSVLQDPNLAASYGTHVLLLFADGQSLAGAMSEVMNEENLNRLYGMRIKQHKLADSSVWYAVGESTARYR